MTFSPAKIKPGPPINGAWTFEIQFGAHATLSVQLGKLPGEVLYKFTGCGKKLSFYRDCIWPSQVRFTIRAGTGSSQTTAPWRGPIADNFFRRPVMHASIKKSTADLTRDTVVGIFPDEQSAREVSGDLINRGFGRGNIHLSSEMAGGVGPDGGIMD